MTAKKEKKVCTPRRGSCSKKPTTQRVAADVRVAWINYELRDMCQKHAEQWDKELDAYIETMQENQWGSKQSWIKARDMGLFIRDGVDPKEASNLVQSDHGYDPSKLPKVVRLS